MKQFLNVSETMTEFGISEASARSLVRGVRDNIPERYHESDIVGHYKCSVRAGALMDFSRHGDNLETAPAYKPLEMERELGIGIPAVNPHDLAIEVVRTVISMVGGITV